MRRQPHRHDMANEDPVDNVVKDGGQRALGTLKLPCMNEIEKLCFPDQTISGLAGFGIDCCHSMNELGDKECCNSPLLDIKGISQ